MAFTRHPKTIYSLARRSQLPICCLSIKCRNCNRELTYLDKKQFDYKTLCLLWEEDVPYGLCEFCCKRNAYCQLLIGCTEVKDGHVLEEEERKYIKDIRIRCYVCFTTLCTSEKLQLLDEGELLLKICGKWRGRCCRCRLFCEPNNPILQ
ncbi:E6 [Boa constrictor papillomavirus 1]|uniref:E6 n=1 Tax=Boa constrictor papillomavirus 1 TaxID=2294156 RepID=UPI000E3369DD|nr:E6 [Boa constrictor papillomavirus 1]AXL96274.1 E6 [Boa constrictor papillomavirus 1]